MGVQYSFCKSFLEQSLLFRLPATRKQPVTETRTDFLISCWKADCMCTILISAEEMAASGESLWFTDAEYIPRCVTEYTHLNINSSDCWSRGKKLLQVCPADEQFKLQDLRRFQVHLPPVVSVTAGREVDPVYIFCF